MTGCDVLIVAAGRGTRLGGEVPKQYRSLAGRSVLRRSVEAFVGHAAVDGVRVVIHPDDRGLYEPAVSGLDLMPPVAGGASRQDSVARGLRSLRDRSPEAVLIHDAARPFVDGATIGRVVGALADHDGAIAAVPVVDTLKRGVDDTCAGTVDRAGLWRAQTPQGFRYQAILAAHEAHAGQAMTDDAAIAEAAGLRVRLVESSDENFKVTTEDDLRRAERMLADGPGDVRTGMGFDVHRFGPGDHVWLCGVKIPHEAGLVGHSDADAGLHALTDAILGAIAAGDIGAHFPPSDPKWKDAPSDLFLRHAADLVTARGGAVCHVDLTLVCEAPRIRPHVAAMTQRVAEILGVAPDRVGIKATTTERLGFTGRGEGIAAQAVATVRLGVS